MTQAQLTSGDHRVPYAIIAESFRNGTVVPFLGAAASVVGADSRIALPGGTKLAKIFAECSEYPGPHSDPLTKVTQFLEEVPADRHFLLNMIVSLFYSTVDVAYRCCICDFLGWLPSDVIPALIITTNYDVLVERALAGRGIPYVAISHIMRNSKYAGRYLCYADLNQPLRECVLTRSEVEDRLEAAFDETVRGPVLLYKMHGTARLQDADGGMIDSIVLTEADYIEFLEEDRLSKIPTRILQLIRGANLLFLGYSLGDWNLRVLLRRLRRIQSQEAAAFRRHWACRLGDNLDEVESRFWACRGVNLYRVPLDEFLLHLRLAILEGRSP